MNQACRVSFHQRDSSVQPIRHIHHVHQCSLLDRTHKLLSTNSWIINVNCVVSSTATRRCNVGNQTWETYWTCVNTVLLKIVVTEQLCGYLWNAIDGARALNSVLRCLCVRSAQTERANRTWSKDSTVVLTCHFQDVPQTINTNFPSQSWLLFCHYRE